MLDFEPGGVLLAMVKKENLKHKTGSKGTGKGTGKGKGTGGHRTCYKRGSEDHIAAACPVRTARVDAGAPERSDKATRCNDVRQRRAARRVLFCCIR